MIEVKQRTVVSLLSLFVATACDAETQLELGVSADETLRDAELAEDDPVDDETLAAIKMLLPENTAAPAELFEDFTPGLEAQVDTDIWVTFVLEGAGYKNAFGYFTYPADQPPEAPLEAEELAQGLVFNNASALLSGGKLYNGRRMYIGTLPAGHKIGFYLVANGFCTSGQGCDLEHNVNFSRMTYYTLDELNPEQSPEHRRHVVQVDLELPGDARLLAWEDLFRDSPGSDDDFNDLAFRITATPTLLADPDEPVLSPSAQGGNVYRMDGGNIYRGAVDGLDYVEPLSDFTLGGWYGDFDFDGQYFYIMKDGNLYGRDTETEDGLSLIASGGWTGDFEVSGGLVYLMKGGNVYRGSVEGIVYTEPLSLFMGGGWYGDLEIHEGALYIMKDGNLRGWYLGENYEGTVNLGDGGWTGDFEVFDGYGYLMKDGNLYGAPLEDLQFTDGLSLISSGGWVGDLEFSTY